MSSEHFNNALSPSEDELRKAFALLCHDALTHTRPIPSAVQDVLATMMHRLVLGEPLTVEDERKYTAQLLAAGASLSAPWGGRALEGCSK